MGPYFQSVKSDINQVIISVMNDAKNKVEGTLQGGTVWRATYPGQQMPLKPRSDS